MSPADAYFEPLPWETRNLGIDAFSVGSPFFTNPDERTLKGRLLELQKAHTNVFVQARCRPDTRTSQILEAGGFYSVETTLCPHIVLSRCAALERFAADPSGSLPERYRGSNIDVVGMTATDRAMAAAVVEIAGESFINDRFHVDHNCDAGVADRRFRLWAGDLVRDNAVRFHLLIFQTRPIAFMATRGGNLVLAGFSRRYANAGLGEFFWLRVLQNLRADGVSSASTLIAVNNIAVLNLYARLGFKFRDPQSTFHLWRRA